MFNQYRQLITLIKQMQIKNKMKRGKNKSVWYGTLSKTDETILFVKAGQDSSAIAVLGSLTDPGYFVY